MDPVALLRDTRAAGLRVTAEDGGRLSVRGPRRLAELAKAILAEKAAVLAALRVEAALAVFPGARVVTGQRAGLRCGRCGTSDWRPAERPSAVVCQVCHPTPTKLAAMLAEIADADEEDV